MQSSPTPAPTVGEIARRLGQPVHRVEYVIRSRHIRPVSRAGNCRVFAEEDVARIATILDEIEYWKGSAR
jgi:DNA-binding transcriptional MerR regulator